MAISGFAMIKVSCSNMDRSIDFYRALGFTVVNTTERASSDAVSELYGVPGSNPRTAVLELPGAALRLELVEWQPCIVPEQGIAANMAGTAMFSLACDNFDADAAMIEAAGGRRVGPPLAFPLGKATIKLSNFLDPDGLQFQLVHYARS